MVEMAVRNQDAVKLFEPQAAAQNLALGALAAIDQEAVFFDDDDMGRQPTMHRWCRGRCTQEMKFKHAASFSPDFDFGQEQPVAAWLVLVVDWQSLAGVIAVRANRNVKFTVRETLRKRNIDDL